MRILYLGTPAVAAAPLRMLHAVGFEIVGVVTQPDRPAGRKRVLTPPPVKQAALELGLPVLQPESLKDASAVQQLRDLAPDVGIVAAYGEILRRNVLELPPLGYLNIHPSLLPLYRGPAPTTGAILAGDDLTGVSIIKLTPKMDAGPILAQATLPLPADARAGRLTHDLMELGAKLIIAALPRYAAGEVQPQPQDEALATYTALLTKADGLIDWSLPALVIERMTRAYDPWPGATTTVNDQPLRVISARVHADWRGPESPGTLIGADVPLIATGSGALELLDVQPAGKRPMAGNDWRHGAHNVTKLGS